MAVGIHVVHVAPKQINSAGAVLDKTSATIGDMLESQSELRVLADSAIASSSGYPTIKTYLEREAAIDYVAEHISNTMIVTYDVGAINAAT